MNVRDEILQRLDGLPAEKLTQVLAYISGLESEDDTSDELAEWSAFSLAQACKDLDDDGPEYTIEDVIERNS